MLAALGVSACGPQDPCAGPSFVRMARASRPFAGSWVVTRGDTLTFPDSPPLSDRFRLAALVLDTTPRAIGRTCVFQGRLAFHRPRAETLAVRWYGLPDQAIVQGWPADLGPFAGIAVTWWGRDSLRGSVLLDAQLGVAVPPGVTAQFVAGRLSSGP